MKHQTIRVFGAAGIVALWTILALFSWFGPRTEISEAERRPLAQMPAATTENIFSGKFMSEFEDFALDQFPLRDSFRTLKSLFHYNVLGQKDNNGIYLENGYAAQQEYPLNQESLDHAAERFQYVYDKYLADSGCAVSTAIIPDKGYYLAAESGQLALDYEALFAHFREKMPWASHIDLTGTLALEDYYRTDTHWRQENLLEAAGAVCEGLGVTAPRAEDYYQMTVEPFYGVYYGQAALPIEPDTLCILKSELLDACTVYNFENGKTTPVYDMDKLQGKDLYEVFLSGSVSLLEIENPQGQPGKELIVFRDSFGSALAPLLVQDYAKVTLVDIRYIQIDTLERFVEFQGQDVLFLYSTLVLNNSSTIK